MGGFGGFGGLGLIEVVLIGFGIFYVYFTFKVFQFVLTATDLYKEMVKKQTEMVALLSEMRDNSKVLSK